MKNGTLVGAGRVLLLLTFLTAIILLQSDFLKWLPRHSKSPLLPLSCSKTVFVHIGKTGGSSARCILPPGMREEYCKSKNLFNDFYKSSENTGVEEGLNTRFGNVYTLCHMHNCGDCLNHTTGGRTNQKNCVVPFYGENHKPYLSILSHLAQEPCAIVTMRNPFERMMSWWDYEKSHKLMKECFRDLSDLALRALGPVPSSEVSKECLTLAKECTLGRIPCSNHNAYNYEYYLEPLFSGQAPSNLGKYREGNKFKDIVFNPKTLRLFAIRNSYKWQDIEKINLLFGGKPHSYSHNGSTVVLRRSEAPKPKWSPEASQAFCRHLCPEFQYYLRVFDLAVNLDEQDRLIAIDDLNQSCQSNILELCPSLTSA